MKFTELLEEYNIPIAPEGSQHQTVGWIQFDCPFCGKDSQRWHMGYNISGGFVNCWKCGSHSLGLTLKALINLPWRKIHELINSLGQDTRRVFEEPIQSSKKVLVLPKNIQDISLSYSHKKYLLNRRFNWKELVDLWNIRCIGISGELSWRLFIPIIYKGQIVSWDTRAIGKDIQKRYIGAHNEQELIPRKHLLYGSDYARNTIIVVEGYPDVWRIGPGAVAVMGINYSQKQVLAISKYPKRYVLFDAEKHAQKQTDKLCCELAVFPGETINLELEKASDPAEASDEVINGLRKLLKG